MNQRIVQNTSSDELLAASDTNRIAYWAPYGRGIGCNLEVTSDSVWFYTGIDSPLFNGVISINTDPDKVRTIIKAVQQTVNQHGAPALWWLGPDQKSMQAGSVLKEKGLESAGEIPSMAIDLDMINTNPQIPAGLDIKTVSTSELKGLWAQIAAMGTGFSDEAIAGMAKIEASLNDPQYNAQFRYLGYLADKPVAASALVLDSGVAGIYAVATLPEDRGRGIGRLMTELPLLEAKQLGYRVGTLQASSMGYPLYKKIGFRDICKYSLYLQTPGNPV